MHDLAAGILGIGWHLSPEVRRFVTVPKVDSTVEIDNAAIYACTPLYPAGPVSIRDLARGI